MAEEPKTTRARREKKPIKKKYIVVFQDEDGTVLKTSFVPEGEAAQPPEIPKKKEETAHHERLFSGWTPDYAKVEANLVVKAVYETTPKKYLVMYFHENEKLLGMESVPYGSAAKANVRPEKAEDEAFTYTFAGWNCPLDRIEKDTNARAVFTKQRKVFSIRYYQDDGQLLREEQAAYGEPTQPPAAPEKEADAVYRYEFAGWSNLPERVTENRDIYAKFTAIYQEYTAAFYDGEQLLQKGSYHYGDSLSYPAPIKKGYALSWSKTPQTVEESCEIHARWDFAGPVGKEEKSGKGVYRIVNPSIKNGTVLCIQYTDETSACVTLPERVKLGDYYYRVEGIGPQAFAGCVRMEKLRLPDSLSYVEKQGLAHCRQVRSITFGKGLRSLGADAFARNVRLQEITLPGRQFRTCHKKAFDHLPARLTLHVLPACQTQTLRVLEGVNRRERLTVSS